MLFDAGQGTILLRCFSATLGAAIPTHVHPITTPLQARTKQ
jgi:hypothetical protein